MRKTDWTGNVVKESTCYRIAIGSHQLGINVIGFENGSTNKSFKYAISSAQLSPDGRFLALIGGGDHPEQAYDTSCFAQPSKESKLAEGTSLDDMPGLIQKTRLMQAAMSAPSKGAVAYNRRTSIEYAKGSARLNQSHRTGQGGEQSYFDEPPNASTLTIWDAETGTRIMRSLYSGKLVWCNFEMIGDVTTAFITADANGLIKLWNWNAIGTLKDDVFYRNMMFAGSNMKVETLCFSVAGFESSQIIGYSSQPQSGLLAVLMMEESKNIVQFWNLETGERFKSFDCVVTSAPYLNLTKSSLTMPLSWGIPADSLFRFCRLKKSIEKYTSRPACFVAGVDRFHISADFEPSKSESVRSTLEKLWGKEIYHEFTASCQSLHDESIMIVAKGAEMVWISEEMYPIRPISDANPAIDALKEESDVEPDVGPHKSNYRRESHRTSIGGRRESHRAIHGRGSLSVSALAEDTALELNNTTLDYCRIRRIKCDAGETIIALHHVKSYTVDCIVACTSNGTVLVYDIKIPSQYVSKMHAVKEIEEPAKLIGIWHARTPLSGMTVRMVCGAQNSEEYEETKLVRCRIALYGLNGFATVLNLQLK
ncbi:hypothetical protein BC830DRAFT_1167428 [Chytriomyces sp. MP71]|nr:hypothetical protein BC830DRAFT_1167428 [Chytriomyces sp. MP71]